MALESKDVIILAVESSCDETAAAVVKNGRHVLSSVISSQILCSAALCLRLRQGNILKI